MRDELIRRVAQLLVSHDRLYEGFEAEMQLILNDYEIGQRETAIQRYSSDRQTKAIEMYFVTKRIEGTSPKSLEYYKGTLDRVLEKIGKPIFDITGDDIKYYFAIRMARDNVSKCTMDNERRVLNAIFEWLVVNEYLPRNPVRKVGVIKQEKKLRKYFTETDMERIRIAAELPLDRALVEFLYSTGARVSEASGANRTDIHGEEIKLFGKGSKERIAYLNERAVYYLSEYLKTRTDNDEALFVSERAPYKRLQPGGIEVRIREIGKNAGIEDCHPHRFRHTCATMALNRGMPIDQVQKMLGHEKIETTTIYAKSLNDNVRESHRKYVT